MLRQLIAAFVAAGVGLCAAAAQAAPPIEAYGADPEVSDVEVSADGSKLAMARSENGESVVLILDRSTNTSQRYSFGEASVRNVEWTSANHVLVYATQLRDFLDYGKTIFGVCTAYSIDTRRQQAPTALMRGPYGSTQRGLCNIEARLWTDTGDVVMWVYGDLMRVSGDTGEGKLFVKSGESTNNWVISPKGHVVARIDHAQKSNRYRVLVPTDEERMGDWKTLLAEDTEIPNYAVQGTNKAETALIVSTRVKSDVFGLFEMSLQDGSLGKPLFEPDGVDIGGVISDPYTGAIVGVSYVKDRTEQIFFENDLQAVLMGAKAALTDWQTVMVTSWDRDRQTFVIYAEGTKSAGDYFILDRKKGGMQFLARLRPQIKPDDLGQVRAFSYFARDGVEIPAYLTLPPGTDAKNLPVVVYPHGGPSVRDSMEFDYWAQAVASRVCSSANELSRV